MRQKELYVAPETEVLELRLEGAVLTMSNVDSPNAGQTNEGVDWGEYGY